MHSSPGIVKCPAAKVLLLYDKALHLDPRCLSVTALWRRNLVAISSILFEMALDPETALHTSVWNLLCCRFRQWQPEGASRCAQKGGLENQKDAGGRDSRWQFLFLSAAQTTEESRSGSSRLP